jgi:hypothetical protein
MRKFITIARVRGEDAWEMLFGPETPYQDQRAAFKEAKSSGVHPRWDLVQIVEVANHGDIARMSAPQVPTPQPPAPAVVPDSVVVPPGTVVTEPVSNPNPAPETDLAHNPIPQPPAPDLDPAQVTEPDDESAEFDTSKARPRRATGSRK